jgi:hypothetical protein
MPHTALRRHSTNVKSKTRASCITVTARCIACDMSRAVVRWKRRDNERHDTFPITARVIGGRCVHNPPFQESTMGVELHVIRPVITVKRRGDFQCYISP